MSADVLGELAIDPTSISPSLDGLGLVVSPLLPMPQSPGQEARQIVRHGFAAARAELGRASLFPDSLGDVGPKPGALTRAIRMGRTLMVDRDLALEIDLRWRDDRAKAAAAERVRRRDRAILDGISTALRAMTSGGIHHVTATRDELYRYTFHAHPGELEPPVVEVTLYDDEVHAAGGEGRLVNLAVTRLHQALVERKLDDEEAGRGR